MAPPHSSLRIFFKLSFRLLLLLSEQGTILDRSWRQLREYDSQASQVLPWLNSAEDRLGRSMAQPVKTDPAIIKQQINELKVSNTRQKIFWFIPRLAQSVDISTYRHTFSLVSLHTSSSSTLQLRKFSDFQISSKTKLPSKDLMPANLFIM